MVNHQMSSELPGLFITGTDTNVGKTYVAAMIVRALVVAGKKVGVYKPAASGCRQSGNELISDDALALWEAAGRPGPLEYVCPQRFAAPLAPHLAARAEGREIDRELLLAGLAYWRERSEVVVVEGAGGLLSPLADKFYVADLAAAFGLPLVIVAPNRIGVINQTLQTVHAAQSYRSGLRIAGVVLNETNDPATNDDPSRSTNLAELRLHSPATILGAVAGGSERIEPNVNWWEIALQAQHSLK